MEGASPDPEEGALGDPIGTEEATTRGGQEIGPREPVGALAGAIGTEVARPLGVQAIGPRGFGLPGASIEAPGAYQGGSPVGGPGSLFNIGGAPIAVLGGVFSGGLPLGGPVTQIFRSGGPVPNTLFISTLESSGPIGTFFLGTGGEPIGEAGELGVPIGVGPAEGGRPIGGDFSGGLGR